MKTDNKELSELLQDIFYLHGLVFVIISISLIILNKISDAYAKSAESK